VSSTAERVDAERPYSVAEHLAGLDETIAKQEAHQRGGGWLARTVQDALLAKIEANKPPSPDREIEAVLVSGLAGAALLNEMWARFGQATRWDVFLGVASAVTILTARATLAEIDASERPQA